MSFFTKTKEATFEELNTSKNGLTEEEASKRLEEYGHNKLAEGKKKEIGQGPPTHISFKGSAAPPFRTGAGLRSGCSRICRICGRHFSGD